MDEVFNPHSARYLGIDLSLNGVNHCKEIFSRFKHASFVKNDDLSLAAATDGEFDFVFSFESLVHVEADVMTSYIGQTLQKLRQTGVAFFNHSNALEFAEQLPDPAPGSRARSVSGESVRKIIETHGGRLLVQELTNWIGDMPDCFTLFACRDYPSGAEPAILRNSQFYVETSLIREFHSHYSRVGPKR